MHIIERKNFRKAFQKSDIFIKKKVKETLSLFFVDPLHPMLRNHALKGNQQGQRTLDVTGDWRIVFRELSEGKYELVELIDLGTHSQLYK